MGINGLLKALSPLLIPENEIPNNDSANTSTNIQASSSFITRSASSPKHNIRQFANKSLAIDASSWLYKASYSCAEQLVEAIEANRIDKNCENRLCTYMVKRCEEMIKNANIQRIYIVFDGKRCPLKEATNMEREMKRQENLKEARRLMRMGNRVLAGDKYRACVKVTDWMADSVHKAIKLKWGNNCAATAKVSCVFSPYEADAQLVKLCMDGFADAIVTEDSDVLVYSAACKVPVPVIYKLSRDDGSCDVITMDWLIAKENGEHTSSYHSYGYPSIKRKLVYNNSNNNINNNKTKSASKKEKRQKVGPGSALLQHLVAISARESRQQGSGSRMFVQACCLSGCDYAPNRLAGVGIMTAFKLIKENAHRDVNSRFLHILKSFPREKIIVDETIDPIHDTSRNRNTTISIKREDLSQIVQSYESLLAKSEAVFYYHPVRDISTNNVVPLLEPPSFIESNKSKTGSLHDFLPITSRFNDDLSFTGIDNLSSNSMAFPSKTNRIANPNDANNFKKFWERNRSVALSSTTAMSTIKQSTDSGNIDLKSSSKTILSIFSKTTKKTMVSKCDSVIEESSSVDDLDEDNVNLPVITPNLRESRNFTPSLTTGQKFITSEQNARSKYFTFCQENTNNVNSRGLVRDSSSLNVPLVTPDATMGGSRSDEDVVLRQGDSTLLSEIDNDDYDSNDCVILDNNSFSPYKNNGLSTKPISFLGKNKAQSIFGRFQCQSYQMKETKVSKTTSFSKVQDEGVRAKIGSMDSTKNKRKGRSKPASISVNKRQRIGSIKAYFTPLNTQENKINK